MDTAIELFQRAKSWNDDAAKKLCFQLFAALGADSTTTKRGRKKLANLMH
jgi:thioredoxin-like negative regulator of GroEL